MKKTVVALCIAMLVVVTGVPGAAADVLEKVLVLQLVDEVGVSDWGMVEVLQGYDEYREMMDGLDEQRAEKRAELAAAIEADESAARLTSLTRELMDIDMNILRTLQGSVSEAGSVLGTKATAQLYLLASDLDKAKADLLAELTGAPAAVAAMPAGAPAVCPLTGQPCPMQAAAPVELTEEYVLEQVALFLGKVAEKDLDAAMAAVADDFEHYQYRTKEELRNFLDDAIFVGYLDDVEIKMDDAEVEIDGDKGVVYPVDILGSFGSVTLELIGELRDGKLMLVSMDAFGL